MISQTGIRDGAYISESLSEYDFDNDNNNADVPETGDSDTFKSLDNNKNHNLIILM